MARYYMIPSKHGPAHTIENLIDQNGVIFKRGDQTPLPITNVDHAVSVLASIMEWKHGAEIYRLGIGILCNFPHGSGMAKTRRNL